MKENDEHSAYKAICNEVDPPEVIIRIPEDPSLLEVQRKNYCNLFRAFPVPPRERIEVRDELIELDTHSIPVRWFQPRDTGPGQTCIIYAHGGGFICGTVDVADGMGIDLADRLNVTVVTYHYRLAPEHIFPAPLEDGYTVLQHVAACATSRGVDPNRLILSGESCGGNFAAALCLLARDRGGPPILGHVPINPVLDVHRWARREVEYCSPDFQSELYQYTSLYLGDHHDVSPEYASPLLARDLSALPPALIWTVSTDPLSEEARLYACRLAAAGVPCELHVERGAIHGSLRARHRFTFAARAFDTLCGGVERLMGRMGTGRRS
ncbi:esterase [Cystobacter fuscus]|uniref:Esterase n=1 Tax=Cystobacter fuscus TaxID=43 RepID=A0A250JH19_9BACT|nr:alpha/beta hydrolase [Cystobacter fuscus]ATB42898.1 esterase [Cystobacter fuscus]